jgi:high affinity Mn2+ porin
MRLLAQLGTVIFCAVLVWAATSRVAYAQVAASSVQSQGAATASSQSDETVSTNGPAQQTDAPPAAPAPPAAGTDDSSDADPLTVFPHSETARYWLSGQGNVVFQWHSRFPAKYTGPQSLTPWPQSATTHVLTLYAGYELTNTTEVFADAEYATGGGIAGAFGLAGYTNLDSVRTVSGAQLPTTPYLARLMIRQIIPLSDERVEEDRDELHLATSVPARRIEFRVGKFDLADFFDLNTWGQDSHLQFLNWTVDNNGAWDYAANTRGYTDGVLLEYDDHWWTVRFAEALEPKIANGIHLDADVARSRAENLELEARGSLFANRAGVVRLLSYLNHADMGSYAESVADYLTSDRTSVPNIIDTRREGRHKYGFGLNFEQAVTSNFGIFGRLGWSDGHNESWAYTEDDRTIEIGGFFSGAQWHRKNDRAGVAFVANGIAKSHQTYLADGGLGFLLGDGALTYGPEEIFEGFYTTHIWRGFFASFDIQHINNPGYNQARGPVTVPGLRLHVDF